MKTLYSRSIELDMQTCKEHRQDGKIAIFSSI